MYDKSRAENITTQMASLLQAYEPLFDHAPHEIRCRYAQLRKDAAKLRDDVHATEVSQRC